MHRSRIAHAWRSLAARSTLLSSLPLLAGFVALGDASYAQNLLVNPSFESGLNNWAPVSGTASVVSYGTPNTAVQAVATRIGGLNQLVRDASGNAVIEQIVATGPIPAGTNVRASAFLGGSGNSDCHVVFRFLDAANMELQRDVLTEITSVDRNGESVLMLRERIIAPPANTVSVAVRVEFGFHGSGLGLADKIGLELVSTSTIPPPLPMNTQLLVNGDFESGWSLTSPLTLTDAQGWFGGNGSTVGLRNYAVGNPSLVPTPDVSTEIGGGGNLLGELFGGDAKLYQRLEVSGNSAAINAGQLALKLSAYLGGLGNSFDSVKIDVDFQRTNGPSLGTESLGPILRSQRNEESVLMLREKQIPVPALTERIVITLAFDYTGGTASALIDNVVAELVTPVPPAPIPLGVNLVANGAFEYGFLGASPLQLTNPTGWEGVNNSSVEILQYGISLEAPSLAFAKANGLGGLVLSDFFGGGAQLVQEVDLRGVFSLISSNRLRIAGSCWLGGFGSNPGSAQMQIQFFNASHGPIAGGLMQFPPVTAAERGNVTLLLPRVQDDAIPPTAAFMKVTVQFNYGGGSATGLADNINVVAYDTLATSFDVCAGDGSWATCPCGNNGTAGHGCANSTNPAGALLALTGSTNPDTITLSSSGMPATATCIYLQGDAWNVSGAVFGDGLRCVDGTLIRLKNKTSVGGASQYPEPGDPSVSLRGLVVPGNGDMRLYQVYYRNSTANFCPPQTFNVTNGWVVVW